MDGRRLNITKLSLGNFSLTGMKQKALILDIQGPVFVLFTSGGSDKCQLAERTLRELSTVDKRVMFAIMDVDENRNIIAWSRQTTTSIQDLPNFILYANGKPLAKFKGSINVPSIQGFITSVVNTLKSQQPQQGSFVQTQYPPRGLRQSPEDDQGNFYGDGPSSQGGRVNYPENIGKPSSFANNLMKKSGLRQHFGSVDEEDDTSLRVPDDIVPYNTPWTAAETSM